MAYVVIAVSSLIALFFVYSIGVMQGTQKERARNEKERLDVVRRSLSARINADVSRLQRKYKTK